MSEAEQIADRFIAEISDGWGEDVEREDKERLAELISAALAAKDVEIATLRLELAEARADAADFQWLRDNPEHPHYPYFEDGCWHFPYEVSNAGGSGGGVGLANFDTLHEAIDEARKEMP